MVVLPLAGAGSCRELDVTAGNNLPIPPPAELELKSAGVYEARGEVEALNATVLIRNLNTSLVFGENTQNGSYRFDIDAVRGDCIALWVVTEDGWRTMNRLQTVGGSDTTCETLDDAGP